MGNPKALWQNFCEAQQIAETAVPLFACGDDLQVETCIRGIKKPRHLLRRSESMEELILRESSLLVEDWENRTHEFDGLIYLMFWLDGHEFVPLYIGKTETVGRGRGNLSANVRGLHRDKGKFARWGDGYAYHIGDLSAAVLSGHDSSKVVDKYKDWASRLFVQPSNDSPVLRRQVYFWAKAWKRSDVGIWPEFGETRLSFLEYLLIGVASAAYPQTLLNREGHNRAD